MTTRFKEAVTYLSDFTDEILVQCPRCEHAALVRRHSEAAKWKAVLTCTSCGHSAISNEYVTRNWEPKDVYFGLPLWLQSHCQGHTLWAYNRAHLDFISRYIAADLRERTRDPVNGWSNRSYPGRLPTWMTAAKSREAVLECIARLRTGKLLEAVT